MTLGVSESVHVLANEPSLALFRLEEHVAKSVPALAESKRQLLAQGERVQGAAQDLTYAAEQLGDMRKISHIAALQRSLQRALVLVQQNPRPCGCARGPS